MAALAAAPPTRPPGAPPPAARPARGRESTPGSGLRVHPSVEGSGCTSAREGVLRQAMERRTLLTLSGLGPPSARFDCRGSGWAQSAQGTAAEALRRHTRCRSPAVALVRRDTAANPVREPPHFRGKGERPGRDRSGHHRTGIALMTVAEMFGPADSATKWFESRVWAVGEIVCMKCGSVNADRVKSRKPVPCRCRDCR